MSRRRQSAPTSIYEIFSDMTLLMLGTFIFLFVLMLLGFRFGQVEHQSSSQQQEIKELKAELAASQRTESALERDLRRIVEENDNQFEHLLADAGVGKKDFDLFVKGLRDIPGESVHLVVDATGSMRGVSGFLVPILRTIMVRADKRLDALTWFVDNRAQTYTGTMAEMLDELVSTAPFSGSEETIGAAFRSAAINAPKPGAYILIGDEPSDDKIYYPGIQSPVFTLPFGRRELTLEAAFREIAEQTGGRMLMMDFK
ncbi:MAG: intracellular growth attenuator family protein [Chromatiales bacterium]|nr:intracellular growth attenuator family protein [Chromatiales bacterium]